MSSEESIVKVFGNFSKALIEYYEVYGTVVNRTALHVGSGRDTSPGQAIDNPVVRLPDGRPYIPGSSLKGVFRSIVESYLVTVASERDRMKTSCAQLFRDNNVTPELFTRVCSPTPIESEETIESYCVNHGLFGGPDIASHIQLFDLMVKEHGETFTKPGVAIDRFLGASRPGALYNIELVAPDTKWEFRMRIYGVESNNSLEWRCAREALAFLLEYIGREGFSLGGRVSAGHGYMVFDGEPKVRHVYVDEDGRVGTKELSFKEFIKRLKGGGE